MCEGRSAGGNPQPTGRPPGGEGRTSGKSGLRAGAARCAEQARGGPDFCRFQFQIRTCWGRHFVRCSSLSFSPVAATPSSPRSVRRPDPGCVRDTPRHAHTRAQPAGFETVCPLFPPAEHQPDPKSVSQAEFGLVLPGVRSYPEGEVHPVPPEQTGRAGLWASPTAKPRLVQPSSGDGCGQERFGPALQVLASQGGSPRGATLPAVVLGFPRWGPVHRSSIDTPGRAPGRDPAASRDSIQPAGCDFPS